ncbi:MFS transporter [Anaeromyxobacter oryzae]|uniref:MFS transporter n=1 Tax=Anaeromyxobacter oryzae TaxID=2918170 RepID=A0ABM7WYT0_9BACT|nr:MFS transporter [Anaeromyxobacter oryzae]BDG04692.1 MFS transporter [Anaeromyxobacter oryzae]
MHLRSPRSPWIAFSAIAVGTFMATLDGNIVNVALPTIGAQLHATIDRLEWAVTAYLLAISATLLTMGRAADLVGLRTVYVAGLVVFTFGSALCGAAPSFPALVAARVFQAVGASATMAVGPAVVTATFPAEQRGRALGAVGTVVALGLTAGPPIGGLILAHLSWRWVFYVNVPVGIAGAAWAARILPRRRPGFHPPFDGPGAGLLALALASLLAAVDRLVHPDAIAVALLVVGGGAAAALAWRERRAPSPLVDGALFRSRPVSLGLLAGLLSYAAMFSQTFLTPFYLARVLHLPPGRLGLALSAVPIALSVASPLSGWLSDRIGARVLPVAGMVILAAGLVLLSAAGAHDALASVMARLAVCGVGMGLFQAPNNSVVMGSLPRQRLGSGGGLLATARNVGMGIGVALAGSLFALRAGSAPAGPAFLSGYALALRTGAALAIAAAACSVVRAEASRSAGEERAPGAGAEAGRPTPEV